MVGIPVLKVTVMKSILYWTELTKRSVKSRTGNPETHKIISHITKLAF